MTGSPGSVSPDPARVLVCGLNWIGDSVMAMPALQAYRAAHPEAELVAVVKPTVAGLWRMHPAVDRVVDLGPGVAGVRTAAAAARRAGCTLAFVLPRSIRSALVAWLARVPTRVGMSNGLRNILLTRAVRPRGGEGRRHQVYEYMDVFLPGAPAFDVPSVRLTAGAADRAYAEERLPGGRGAWVGLIPGAARGPSKQWPAERFVEVGRALAGEDGMRVVVFGAPGETGLCGEVATAIGDAAVSLAGETSLGQWAAALARCAVVVANDSGGMHLAAAMGTPVVALYGITDPDRTGPLGVACVLQHSRERARDVPRSSPHAEAALAAIAPDEALAAARRLVQAGGSHA